MKYILIFFVVFIKGFYSVNAQELKCIETQVSVKSFNNQVYLNEITIDKYGNILTSIESHYSNGILSYTQQVNNVYNSKNQLISYTKYLNDKELSKYQIEYSTDGSVKELSSQSQIVTEKTSEKVTQKISYDQNQNINSKAINTVNDAGEIIKTEIFDKNDKLVKSETFVFSSVTNKILQKNVQDIVGNVLFKTVFEYENNNKTKELEYVNNILVGTTINIYNNNLLVSKSKLNKKNELDYIIEYEYDKIGRVSRQIFSNSQTVLSSVENVYDNVGNKILEKQFDKNNKQIKETTRIFKCI